LSILSNTSFTRRVTLISLFLVLTGLIYFNSLKNGFVFDDQHYIVDNHFIKVLDSQGLWDMFSSFHVWDYIPVTYLSLSIDYWLYGLNPAGYHFSNTFLHFLNALLVYQLVFRITNSGVGSFGASLIFLTHPVQVESVAWIAERKNLLSFFFFALSFLAYFQKNLRLLSLLFFLLACLAKPSVVILPLLLILYDVSFTGAQIKNIVLDKAPYFLISLGFAILTLLSNSSGEGLREHPDQNPINTLFSMIVVFKEYVVKFLFPINLNIWYPNQIYKSLVELQVLYSVLAVAGFIWLVRWSYSNKRIVFFGLVWFPIALLPVSHIIPIPQMMADRYLYIAGVGLLIALTDLAPDFKKAKGFLGLAVILMFSLLSFSRTQVYQDEFHLWQDSVSKNSEHTRSMMFLGLSYWGKGERDLALERLKQAIILDPENNMASLYSAHIYTEKEEWSQAEILYRELIQKNPKDAKYYTHLAVFLGNRNQIKESLGLLNHSLELDPDFALAHFNRAVFLDKVGDSNGALKAYQNAAVLNPDSAHYQYILGMFYLKRTDHPELSRNHFNLSLRLNPDQSLAPTIRQALLTLPQNK
jgi:tetratricopeptide (TPR) repeat protein